MLDRSKLPRYAFMSPAVQEGYDEMTRKGTYALTSAEKIWRDKQPYLIARGYSLRPRYSRDWEPSWSGTNIDPHYCEDSIVSTTVNVIDARSSGGELVAIKRLITQSQEIEIAQFVTATKHPHNHCVPMLDSFPDPEDPNWFFIVMPYLRLFNNPEFELVGEVVEFIRQMLEGLEFLHSNSIAHRDISILNIMMDGRPLYPQGHHPVRHMYSADALNLVTPLRRIDHRIEYFYIDFGLSVRFPPGASPLVLGYIGRGKNVPEISATVPWDAYKADVCALGNVFHKAFLQVRTTTLSPSANEARATSAQEYRDTDFIKPLVDCMRQHEPQSRPAAHELVTMFQQLCKLEHPSKSRWRLSARTESVPERVLYDVVAATRGGILDLKRFVG
ncbi:kinase-like domain-containing protein [Lenzites betulinus]|nr:kinase-like domain-containing protein [Lenzites betulinus]